MSVASVKAASGAGYYRNVVLGTLFAVYTFNFVDRLVFSVLQEPIKQELHLTDLHMGILNGLAFAIFYTAVGLPIAWAADRFSRVNIISISLAIWSLFTAASGLATSFGQMFVARLGVGFGEAGCTPPAHSLISDYFSAQERARALAIYSMGIPAGGLIGLIGGGWVVQHMGWREAFFIVGLPGLAMAVLARLILREPKRGAFDSAAHTSAPFAHVLQAMAKNRTFWMFSLGGAMASLGGYGLNAWMVPHMLRTYHMSYTEVSFKFGLIALIPTAIGTFIGGWLGDHLGKKDLRWYPLLPALSTAIMGPMFFLALQMQNPWWLMVIWVLPSISGGIWFAPLFGSIQNLVRPNMRAFASAINLFVVNIIGLGIGPALAGAISTHLTLPDGSNGAQALQSALSIVVWVYVLAAAFFYLASRNIRHDWHGDGQ